MCFSFLPVALVAALCICHPELARSEDIGLPGIDPKDEEAIDLLDKTMTAWRAEDGRRIDNWTLKNGILKNWKLGPHIITRKKFRNFDLTMEFSLPRGGNSGVYLRGRYEVQLYDSQNVDSKKYTGAIWGQIPVESRMYKGPIVWNELSVRLKNKTVTVLVNRKPVIRSRELIGPTRGAIDQNESEPGPILLQSLHGVRFRKIIIKEL